VIVLDASAILAVLLAERGADIVASHFPEAIASAATLAEVLSKLETRGVPSQGAYLRILAFGFGIAPVEVLHARIAAKIALAPRELDLSLGDRLCIALAIAEDCALLTSDRGIAKFQSGIPVRAFR
ncbi:MAG TPA: PIN domain-containing protein, partial [Rhizomicrobium sp.]|jgi:PIN domain nuclease of toxin-antitoxin system